MRKRRIFAAAAALPLAIAGMGIAHADIIENTISADNETATISAGSAVSVGYRIQSQNSGADGQTGCNAADSSPLTLTLLVPAGVSVAGPSLQDGNKLVFTQCGQPQNLNWSTNVPGEYVIGSSYSDAGTGRYTNESQWTLKVNAAAPVDTTGPEITPNVVGTQGNDGWYTSDVTVSWQVTDSGSAISSTSGCDAVTLKTDTTGTTYTCSATSAGGTQSASVTIKRDATAPTVTPGDVVDNTWRNSSLSQDFVAHDDTSGIDDADKNFTLTASADSTVLVPTQATRTVTDAAGNSTTRTLSARIDTQAPQVSPGNVTDTVWRNTALAQEYSANDPLSGLADSGDASFTITASAESVDAATPTVASHTVYDTAGNSTTRTVSAFIDKTLPSVALVGGPTDGGSYYYGDDPAEPTCSASDDLSGLDGACVVSGGGTETGAHTWIATATDNAGNTATDVVSYTVKKWEHGGFYSPVDMGGVWNTVKGGSTVPLKFEVFSAAELRNTSVIKGFTAKAVTCPGASALADVIEVTTTGGTTLRYDSTAGQFIQNWQTPKKPGACYAVTMTTQDGSSTSANFMLK